MNKGSSYFKKQADGTISVRLELVNKSERSNHRWLVFGLIAILLLTILSYVVQKKEKIYDS